MNSPEKPKICVPIQADRLSLARKHLQELAENPKVNLAEVWLDKIKDFDAEGLLWDKPLPVLAVVKTPRDRGAFHGKDSQLLGMLRESAKHGADYIAAPIHLGDRLLDEVMEMIAETRHAGLNPQLILEEHDWKTTPSPKELMKKAEYMKGKGADVVKMAVTPESHADVAKILELALELERQQIRHILISMGDMGTVTRIMTPLHGGEFMFAPIAIQGATAGGQLTVSQLHKAWDEILESA